MPLLPHPLASDGCAVVWRFSGFGCSNNAREEMDVEMGTVAFDIILHACRLLASDVNSDILHF
jgi:hypothetical protein